MAPRDLLSGRIVQSTRRFEQLIVAVPPMVPIQPGPAAPSVRPATPEWASPANPLTRPSSEYIGDWPARREAPAVDVGQLTDEVIRQIDSRATAWRERVGKI
jgi:hypothetical protein